MAARRAESSAPRWLPPSVLLLLAVLFAASPAALALRFDLQSGHTKCISDEIKVDSMAVGKYQVVGPDNSSPDAPLPESHRISLRKICAFYLATDYNGACGPRGFEDDNDKPEVFIVRFQRNATYEALKADKKHNLMDTLQGQDTPDASQLVARYNGPDEILEINKWVSQIIKDGDTREIPYFTSKVPDLIPEETSKEWLSGTKSIRSAGKSLKERVKNNVYNFKDYLTDPRIGPALLLCACISWATIWFKHSQSTQKTPKDEAPKEKTEKRRRPKLSTTLFGQPTTEGVVDPEPKDARQWEMEGSDSD